MSETRSASALQAFVDSLLQSTGQLMVIVDHMQRYPSDSAERSIDDVRRTLLADVLETSSGDARPSSQPRHRCSTARARRSTRRSCSPGPVRRRTEPHAAGDAAVTERAQPPSPAGNAEGGQRGCLHGPDPELPSEVEITL
jgi:hypothetical protein